MYSRFGWKSHRHATIESLESRTVLNGAPIVVNTITDDITPDNSLLSLREAIEIANADEGDDRIRFSSRIQGEIVLEHGELTISDDLEIIGRGLQRLTVSGNDASRVFNIQPEASVTISRLTISDGLANGVSPDLAGYGGGVLNRGDLTLDRVEVTGNRAVGDSSVIESHNAAFLVVGAAGGGGIANLGTLQLTRSTVSHNEAIGADDAVAAFNNFFIGAEVFPGAAFGGGLYTEGEATVSHSRFVGNQALAGSGAIGDYAGTAAGGAIFNDRGLSVSSSTFTINKAIGGSETTSANPLFHNGHAIGGAVMSGSLLPLFGLPGASVEIETSNFYNNRAQGGDDNILLNFDETGAPVPIPPGLPLAVDGPNSGLGGAILVFQGEAILNRVNLIANEAVGGRGGGDLNGSHGVGGGMFLFNFVAGITAEVDRVNAHGNRAIGGDGASGSSGGDGIGGGIAVGSLGAGLAGLAEVTITRSNLIGNEAIGGAGDSGAAGGNGLGGGLANVVSVPGSSTVVERTLLASNHARGGDSDTTGGNGQGGGIYNQAGASMELARSVLFANLATGGDPNGLGQGGGIFNEGDLEIDFFSRLLTRLNEASDDGNNVFGDL